MTIGKNNSAPLTHLGDLSIDVFLRDYWQKKPLLIRQAFPQFKSLISADELAGLSLEDDVNSRLIVQQENNWHVEHGPLAEDRFSELPPNHWTLLVQHADSLHPQLNQLLDKFRFLPNWRVDDIMVSYASDGGSVGPHFDYYDVFLLQAEGKRRWRIGQHCTAESELLPNQTMKILANFDGQEDWVLEPGDILYIPPNIAHWGEAVGECITYSVGFRAPSHADFILDYSQEVAAQLSEDQRFQDPPLSSTKNPAEICPEVIHKLQNTLKNLINDPEQLARWLGQYATEAKHVSLSFNEPVSIEAIQDNTPCQLGVTHRCAYYPLADEKMALCFINGEVWTTSTCVAQTLCAKNKITFSALQPHDQTCLLALAELEWLEPCTPE